MKKIISNKIKLIITMLTIIIVSSISGSSFAANAKIYTSKLTKGESLEFKGKTWAVYKTKTEAQSIGDDKHPKIKRNLKTGEKINILEISGNAIKIKKDEYIYYGSNANRYFAKIQKKKAETDKKQNTQNNKQYTEGDYYVISNSLNDVLKDVGPQNPGECLTYACKYANYLLGNKSTQYHLIGSENKNSLLKVVASEINEGRPVIARAETSTKKKINGKAMCGRHFVTIVRNKKEGRFK